MPWPVIIDPTVEQIEFPSFFWGDLITYIDFKQNRRMKQKKDEEENRKRSNQ